MASLLDMSLLFRRNAPSSDVGAVNVGDRFFKPGQRNQIWTVERLFKPAANALTHVVLRRGGENPETYVISVVALMNPHMFRRDRRDPESINVRGKSRRSMDYVKEPLPEAAANGKAKAEAAATEKDDDQDVVESLGGVSS